VLKIEQRYTAQTEGIEEEIKGRIVVIWN